MQWSCKCLSSQLESWWGRTSYVYAWSSPPFFSILLMFDATAALSLHENASAWAKRTLSHTPPCASPWCGKGAICCSSSLFHFGHRGPVWTLYPSPWLLLRTMLICVQRAVPWKSDCPSEAMLSSMTLTALPPSPSYFKQKLTMGCWLMVTPHSTQTNRHFSIPVYVQAGI